ncbi:GreA/GreB family elongation factor [Flavobacteriales bacterium]|nr:GreA/GreB family elongation factor [Flavobacteriales bacterium]
MRVSKIDLLEYCKTYVAKRMSRFAVAISTAQSDANKETKSSAGDKHETGRAMAQLETENNSKHLTEAKKLNAVLSQIDPGKKNTSIELGAFVKTNLGNYFIAISAGKTHLFGDEVYLISPASPIGQHFLGKKEGDTVSFNQQTIAIQEVH